MPLQSAVHFGPIPTGDSADSVILNSQPSGWLQRTIRFFGPITIADEFALFTAISSSSWGSRFIALEGRVLMNNAQGVGRTFNINGHIEVAGNTVTSIGSGNPFSSGSSINNGTNLAPYLELRNIGSQWSIMVRKNGTSGLADLQCDIAGNLSILISTIGMAT